jgi:hypothetical protein
LPLGSACCSSAASGCSPPTQRAAPGPHCKSRPDLRGCGRPELSGGPLSRPSMAHVEATGLPPAFSARQSGGADHTRVCGGIICRLLLVSGQPGAADVDRPSGGDKPRDRSGEHADRESSHDVDGPVRADLDPIAGDQDGDRRAGDALRPPHPRPQRARCADEPRCVRRRIGVAVWFNRVAVGVEAADYGERPRLIGEVPPTPSQRHRPRRSCDRGPSCPSRS